MGKDEEKFVGWIKRSESTEGFGVRLRQSLKACIPRQSLGTSEIRAKMAKEL